MIRRVLLWALLGVLGAIVAVVQIDRQAYHDPAAIALSPPATSVVARQRMIELAILSGRADAATLAASRHLVRWRPVPAHNLLLYAQSAQLAGEQDRLLPALEVAVSRGWREPLLQVMAGQAALISGDADGAANRIAALIATGAAPEQRRLMLAELLQQAPGRAAFARLFERPGHYSPRLLGALAEVGSPEQLLDIVQRVRQAGIALDCVALRPLAEQWRRHSFAPEADRLMVIGCGDQT